MRTVTLEELAAPLSSHRAVRAAFLSQLPLLDPERVSLDAAAGRVLAETVRAVRAVPAFDSSAVDGYAIRSVDAIGADAGFVVGAAIGANVAVEIMTGHPLPAGADATVPWEATTRDGDQIVIHPVIAERANVRPAGEDLAADAIALERGTVLTPLHVAVAASVGRTHLRAHRQPRVAICSTGDEVVTPGATLGPASVYDANGPMLSAMLTFAGATIVDRVLLADDASSTERWLRDAAEACDLIVSSGGASVGVHDEVRAAVARLGVIEAWRLDVKPGKPVAVGRIAETPIVVLPGNPAGAFIGGWLFAVAAVRALQGAPIEPRTTILRASAPIRGAGARTTYAPVSIVGDEAVPMPPRSSVALGTLAAADGFAIVPPAGAAAGEALEVALPW